MLKGRDLNEERFLSFLGIVPRFRYFPDFFSGKARKTSPPQKVASKLVGIPCFFRVFRIGKLRRASRATSHEQTRLARVVPRTRGPSVTLTENVIVDEDDERFLVVRSLHSTENTSGVRRRQTCVTDGGQCTGYILRYYD